MNDDGPSLKASLAVLQGAEPAEDLLELVTMAVFEHEVALSWQGQCETCDAPFPCMVWRSAAHEMETWVLARVADVKTRLDRYEAMSRPRGAAAA